LWDEAGPPASGTYAANYAWASHASGKHMAKGFWYVYLLRSTSDVHRHYVGMTEDLDERLTAHNAGRVPYTAKFVPWRIEVAIAFRFRHRAVAFERYLKSHAGRAFAKKHL